MNLEKDFVRQKAKEQQKVRSQKMKVMSQLDRLFLS